MAKRRKFTDQFKAKVALEALHDDKTIAAKHQVYPNQVSTWKHQTVEGMANVFARGGKPEGPTEVKIKQLHAKIGRLVVEKDFLSERLKRWAWRRLTLNASGSREMPTAMIKRDHPELSISQQCRLVQLSRSALMPTRW
jgi:transposase